VSKDVIYQSKGALIQFVGDNATHISASGTITALKAVLGNGSSAASGDTLLKFNTSRAWEFQATGSAGGGQHLELKNVTGNNKNFRVVTDGYLTLKSQDGTNRAFVHCKTGEAEFSQVVAGYNDPNDYEVMLTGSDAGNSRDGPQIQFGQSADPDQFMVFGAWSSDNRIDTTTRDFHLYGTNTTTGFYFDESAGKFGIKDATPSYELDVAGDIGFTGTLYGTSGNTIIGNAGSGYIDLKSASATYGVLVRDNDSTAWTNLNSANGYFQIAYMHTSLTQGLFITEPSANTTRVGINDSSPSYPLDVNGSIRAQGAASDIISTDNLYALGMNTTISGELDCRYDTGNGRLEYVSSTRKIKNNIEYVTTDHLDNILSLRPATYELKANPGKLVLGLIAEDSFDVDPLLARLGPDYDYDEQGQVKRNIYTDDPSGVVQKEKVILSDNLVPLDWDPRAVTVSLVKAVQELKAENDALLLRIEQLENA